MSEEQNQNTKKPCKFALLMTLVVISLLMSIAALTMSILNYAGGIEGTNKKIVISKKYDKGRSLDKARETQKPIMVFFYTDWCGFCQRFAPTYDKITKDKRVKKNFAVAFVNCENPDNSKYVKEFNITGFPTVFVIDKDGEKTQLDNHSFFGDDAKEEVIKEALDAID